MNNTVTISLTVEQALDLQRVLGDAFAANPIAHIQQLLDAAEDALRDAGAYEDDEHDQFRSDVEADADALASAGMGTDEDYGYYGPEDLGWDGGLEA